MIYLISKQLEVDGRGRPLLYYPRVRCHPPFLLGTTFSHTTGETAFSGEREKFFPPFLSIPEERRFLTIFQNLWILY